MKISSTDSEAETTLYNISNTIKGKYCSVALLVIIKRYNNWPHKENSLHDRGLTLVQVSPFHCTICQCFETGMKTGWNLQKQNAKSVDKYSLLNLIWKFINWKLKIWVLELILLLSSEWWRSARKHVIAVYIFMHLSAEPWQIFAKKSRKVITYRLSSAKFVSSPLGRIILPGILSLKVVAS